jgi:hypothetical protein
MEITVEQNEKIKKYFKSDEASILFRVWLANSPESFHQCDIERWTQFVLSALENEEDFNLYDINRLVHFNWEDCVTDDYVNRFTSMKDLYVIMGKNGYRRITMDGLV